MIFAFRTRSTFRRWACLFAAATALVAAPAAQAAKAAKTKPAKKEVSDEQAYKGAIVMDAASGKVLFENRADEISPPASMTKLMTFAVLSDKLASHDITLDTQVKIDNADAKIGGTQVFLDPRETFPVEELMYAMMIQSANDAAHALARVSAGSVEAFVELMNAKAREIGMTHTTFRSPHGLPPSSRHLADGDLTTPRDYALLCRYLLLHTDVLKYTSVKDREFTPTRMIGNKIAMKNHNKLLWSVNGCDGLKTGYTEGAGYCLSATAERGGRRVIVVVMGSFGPNGEKDLGKTRDRKATDLIERGFAALPAGSSNFAAERAKYVKPAMISLEAPTTGGAANTAAAASSDGPTIKLSLPHR